MLSILTVCGVCLLACVQKLKVLCNHYVVLECGGFVCIVNLLPRPYMHLNQYFTYFSGV